MRKFTELTSKAIVLDDANIDTDRIIPGRFLKKKRELGFGQYMFYDMRHKADGSVDETCPLNDKSLQDARILIAAENFGCGSSREQAVWALCDRENYTLWFDAIIAPSFGDIFYNNCTKNGTLPIRLTEDALSEIRRQLQTNPQATLAIDLPGQTVTSPSGVGYSFTIDPFRKESLLRGLDDIDLTLEHKDEFEKFEKAYKKRVPWRYGQA